MKKRLLFFSNAYPNPASPNHASYSRQLVDALREHLEVTVLSPIPWPQARAVKGAAVRSEQEWTGAHFPTYWYPPRILRNWYGRTMYWSVKRCAEALNETKPFDAVYAAWLFPDGWAASRLAENWGIPFFVSVIGTDVNRLVPGTPLTKRSLDVISYANQVFCVSHSLKARLASLGADGSRLHTVYTGIDKDIFFPAGQDRARELLRLNSSDKILLFVGNLLKTKGLKELAEAFSALAGVHSNLCLAIVGSGEFEQDIRKTLEADGISQRVIFTGSMPSNEVALWMNAADLLCLPSYMEGLPNVVLESLACGTPVVASEVGGISELASLDGRIMLVPPRNTLRLKAALDSGLSRKDWPSNRYNANSWPDVAKHLLSLMFGGGERRPGYSVRM